MNAMYAKMKEEFGAMSCRVLAINSNRAAVLQKKVRRVPGAVEDAKESDLI